MELNTRIARIRQETPTVKSFLLEVETEGFTFLPGQWIDLYIEKPGQEALVGGFTLISSPTRAKRIELAIKRQWGGRAAVYLYDHARVGETFWIVGPSGDFYFQDGMSDSLVLIAGGIGINPLISMVRYIDALGLKVQITLLYSARSPAELLFSDELRATAARNPLLHCLFTVTQPGQEPWQDHVGRIDKEMVREARPERDALYYVCGPPGMPTAMAEILQGLGVPSGSIRFEEW